MAELCDRKVSGEGRLLAFAPLDPDAHVCRTDHANVVAAVADGRDDLRRVSAQQPDGGRLLGGRAAADDDRGRGARDLYEELRVEFNTHVEGWPVEHQARRVDRALRVPMQQLTRLSRRARTYRVHVLMARDEGRVLRHDERRLELIARKHPRAHVRIPQLLERGTHVRLQTVFDSSHAHARHLLFEHCEGRAHRRVARRLGEACLGKIRRKGGILCLAQRAACNHKRTQPLACEVTCNHTSRWIRRIQRHTPRCPLVRGCPSPDGASRPDAHSEALICTRIHSEAHSEALGCTQMIPVSSSSQSAPTTRSDMTASAPLT